MLQHVSPFWSTGSIGVSCSMISRPRVYGGHAMPVEAITAHSNVAMLAKQAREIRPRLAVVGDGNLYGR